LQATEEQRGRIKAVLAQALDELVPLRSQHHAHRNEILAALSQPAIDREALDRLRKAELALADNASRTLVDSAAAMAETLTPEQRSRLSEMAQHWRGRGHG
jgi:Spy/CpxP family protein refolding chaperone